MVVMEEPILGTTLAENLIRLRKARGWSVSKLAREADVSHGYIEKIEAGGTAAPSVVHLQKLAGALGVSLDDLLTADPDGIRGEATRYETEEAFIERMQAKYGDSDAFRMAVEVFRAQLKLSQEDQRMLANLVRRLAVDD